MLSRIIFAMLLLSASVIADEDQTCNIITERKILGMSDWIQFPITFGHFDGESSSVNESIIISFPSEPTLREVNGMSRFTATDNEGMTYTATVMPIHEKDFNLSAYVESVAEYISNSPSSKHIARIPDPKLTVPYLMWVEGNERMILTFVKSVYYVYILQTCSLHEIYSKDSIEVGTEAWDISTIDLLKTWAFTHSLIIE